MKKLFYLIVVIAIIASGVSLAQEAPIGAGAAKMPLWNSTGENNVGYICAVGALKTDDGPYGFVILNTDASGMLIVQFALKGATPNAVFTLYINQIVDDNCTFPNMVGTLITNGQGNGNAHFNLPHLVNADKFWVSAIDWDSVQILKLRSVAIVLD